MLLGRLFLFLQNFFALHFKRNLHFRVKTAVKGFTVRQSRAIVRGNNTSLIQTVSFANICWVICKASFMHFYGQPCTLMQHFFQHSQELCFSCSLSFSCVFFFCLFFNSIFAPVYSVVKSNVTTRCKWSTQEYLRSLLKIWKITFQISVRQVLSCKKERQTHR